MDTENRETLTQRSQENSAREVIQSIIENARKMGFPVKIPVSPELDIELISGGAHEVMKFMVNGKLAVTLTEDGTEGDYNNEVLFKGRDKNENDIEVRYDKDGNRQIIIPNQQKEHKPEKPGIFKYPGDFPEKIDLRKVVNELKANFLARTSPKTDILSRSSKSKAAGGAMITKKAA